ncbi:zinc-ribbon domain-containing protein [Candidatus Pelagibacter communis]|uniref:zinc-ribbon domain-containing protein n=1 Tax=Pelagibacter ubique TaxID=198252 RepID=UPI00065B4360|nr:zinc-ribbon domain-containing protein [Candidatus Pelagibacter ubique]
MIITCPCEKKKFKIDSSLIPSEGRELQCGSCERVWFYKPQNESEAPLTLNNNVFINKTEQNIELKKKNLDISKTLQQEKIIESEIEKENVKTVEKSEGKKSKLFSYLIVFIISFVALIILVDTLKTALINVFPGLEIILFNLFETLQDIKLFIIDQN